MSLGATTANAAAEEVTARQRSSTKDTGTGDAKDAAEKAPPRGDALPLGRPREGWIEVVHGAILPGKDGPADPPARRLRVSRLARSGGRLRRVTLRTAAKGRFRPRGVWL